MLDKKLWRKNDEPRIPLQESLKTTGLRPPVPGSLLLIDGSQLEYSLKLYVLRITGGQNAKVPRDELSSSGEFLP